MNRVDLKDPAFLKRIAPGLRRLALFPAKTIGIVSVETGIEIAELLAYCKAFGRPDAKDISKLGDLDGKASSVPSIPSQQLPAQRPVAAKEPANGLMPFEVKFRDACRLLLAHPEMKEAAAAKRTGVLSGSWGYQKKKIFGLGPIAPSRLAEYLGVPVKPTPTIVEVRPLDAQVPDEQRGRLLVIVGGKKRLDLEIIVVGEGGFYEPR